MQFVTIHKKTISYTFLGTVLFFTTKFWLDPLLNYVGYKLHFYASRYRKARRPKRIIIVRHGQSEANVDETIYETVPDNKVALSKDGFVQALEAGKKIKELVGDGSVQFFVSPFLRTKQTANEIMRSLDPKKIDVYYDPRLREQEWGNYSDMKKWLILSKLRSDVGKFYYRFSEGESGADVYDRASGFLESLYREMDNYDRKKYDSYVIVSHGLFMRMFVMRFFKYSIEKFDIMANPKNCEIWVLNKTEDGKYNLETEIEEYSTTNSLVRNTRSISLNIQ